MADISYDVLQPGIKKRLHDNGDGTYSEIISALDGMSIPAHDYIGLSYTGDNLTGVVYKTGGASGTTVGTLTIAYDESNTMISVTRA